MKKAKQRMDMEIKRQVMEVINELDHNNPIVRCANAYWDSLYVADVRKFDKKTVVLLKRLCPKSYRLCALIEWNYYQKYKEWITIVPEW